jgi:hypothetical protein
MDLDPSLPSSPYAHVFVEGEPVIPWPKVHPHHYLSKLHARFWGKDIREEMRQWQNQPMVTADQIDGFPAIFAPLYGIDDWKPNEIAGERVAFYLYYPPRA